MVSSVLRACKTKTQFVLSPITVTNFLAFVAKICSYSRYFFLGGSSFKCLDHCGSRVLAFMKYCNNSQDALKYFHNPWLRPATVTLAKEETAAGESGSRHG